MKLGIVKLTDNWSNSPLNVCFTAYVNDYRIYGMKPWGIFDFDELLELSDEDHTVEVWRTMRKPETDYEVRFAYKIDGNPYGFWSDFVFSKPNRLWTKFNVSLKDID